MNLATYSIKETCINDTTIRATADKSARQMQTFFLIFMDPCIVV